MCTMRDRCDRPPSGRVRTGEVGFIRMGALGGMIGKGMRGRGRGLGMIEGGETRIMPIGTEGVDQAFGRRGGDD